MDDILRGLVKALAKEVANELRSPDDNEWVSQHGSPLGPRVHCRAVRGRVERGLPDATINRGPRGKLFRMTKSALVEEMRIRGQKRPLAKATAADQEAVTEPPTGVKERLLRKLGRA